MINPALHEFLSISYLLLPLLFGIAFHGFCIKFRWLNRLAKPIDRGITLRGRPLFGSNKTYRGVVAVALGTAVAVGLQVIFHKFSGPHDYELINYGNPISVLIGFLMGAAAMLAELPNSFVKRQLGIVPGGVTSGIKAALFYFLDQVDMLIGVWIVMWPFVNVTILRVILSVMFLFISHQIISFAGFHLGMRSTSR
ncbi:MAG TPA: CDP-archaeol synthase [Acidobacteriota bacterium]|nr:CDP-archaeol synthase [Acidobacteriota bacterium]